VAGEGGGYLGCCCLRLVLLVGVGRVVGGRACLLGRALGQTVGAQGCSASVRWCNDQQIGYRLLHD
jgi:hypothetical protein